MKNKLKITFIWGALLGAGLSLIKLLGFFSQNIDYPFEPISDLLMVIVFVVCLYMGIKELRDKYQDGLIKYTRAFALGLGITVFAYIIMVIFLIVNYQFIDKDGVARTNQQNIEKAHEAIAKDTATQVEIDSYLSQTQEIITDNAKKITNDTLPQVDSVLHVILTQQWAHVKKGSLMENADNHLNVFAKNAQQSLAVITENVLKENVDSTCAAQVRAIITESQPQIEAIDPADVRFEAIQDKIPQAKNAYDAALKYSIAILLYGIMLDIFVALFLYRNEKTICSRNGNLDENPDGESEETEDSNINEEEQPLESDENTDEEDSNLTENK